MIGYRDFYDIDTFLESEKDFSIHLSFSVRCKWIREFFISLSYHGLKRKKGKLFDLTFSKVLAIIIFLITYRWTPCRRAISVRNKVMCNSLVICNTRPPSPRSLEINSCNTIRSYRETSSCLARAGAEFSHETFEKKEEKKCSCATFGSFIPIFPRSILPATRTEASRWKSEFMTGEIDLTSDRILELFIAISLSLLLSKISPLEISIFEWNGKSIYLSLKSLVVAIFKIPPKSRKVKERFKIKVIAVKQTTRKCGIGNFRPEMERILGTRDIIPFLRSRIGFEEGYLSRSYSFASN